MVAGDDIKNSVALFLTELKKKYRIKAVYIYGSHAKGNSNKWSDIDLAVISPDFSGDLYNTRLELMKMAVRIDDRLEPRPFREDMFDVNDPIVSEVKDHGILFLAT